MSSIFTFDPDPPKALSSPWPGTAVEQHDSQLPTQNAAMADLEIPPAMRLADFGIDSLEPEPQEGPTEYKLHLLLRPRRSFAALSTVQRVSGSHLSKSRLTRSENSYPTPFPSLKTPAATASSFQSRQSRLLNLTTQLLWRLQQSSPNHAASRSDLVVSALPDVSERLDVSTVPGKLLPGLGDSQGALYEIGVADDGTIVGLTTDELDESLRVLRAMASSLGCKVQLTRRIIVGDCQWLEDAGKAEKSTQQLHAEKLWVAEALVGPNLPSMDREYPTVRGISGLDGSAIIKSSSIGRTDQLRVSLTGSTTSGKSTLLGTLSTSTLDNGRGKSRLSLLKHRHEIASGVTSSVTGSLIGYHDDDSSNSINASRFQLVNYASGNISSWTDIHCASNPGRLVFLNDSAGHPRFRRTTVRGLVSWAPHWAICCIAADSEADTAGKAGATASASDVLGSSCAEVDLAKAHLELCLNLGLPLIVVITKLDLASLSALKPTLGKILSVLKFAGRRPEILSNPSDEHSFLTQTIDCNDELEAIRILSAVPKAEACLTVPIVLTSALTGKGIGKLHALLRHLPIPAPPMLSNDSSGPTDEPIVPSTLFHIDEIFAANTTNSRQGTAEISVDSILSGRLQRGALHVGQEIFIGPFSTSAMEVDTITHEIYRANSYPKIKGSSKANSHGLIRSRPRSGDLSFVHQASHMPAHSPNAWRKVHVCSIRNLRLPVHELSSDQAGTVGLSPAGFTVSKGSIPLASEDRIRKGMVLVGVLDQSLIGALQAYSGFDALFRTTESSSLLPGSAVIAYVASIRAPAKILQWRSLPNDVTLTEGIFDFEVTYHKDKETPTKGTDSGKIQQTRITFQFQTSQEWFEVGSQVLVMPASALGASNATGERSDKSSAGLDGLVGTIVQGLI